MKILLITSSIFAVLVLIQSQSPEKINKWKQFCSKKKKCRAKNATNSPSELKKEDHKEVDENDADYVQPKGCYQACLLKKAGVMSNNKINSTKIHELDVNLKEITGMAGQSWTKFKIDNCVKKANQEDDRLSGAFKFFTCFMPAPDELLTSK